MAHAVLSPSGAHRWMACPPSARLEQMFPDTTSEVAEEGTLAHHLAEISLKRYIGNIDQETASVMLSHASHHPNYSIDMPGFVDNYVNSVIDVLTDDARVFVEYHVDLSIYVPGCYGTADCAVVVGDTLHIFDLKYGKGVQVYADENPQLMMYALGVLDEIRINTQNVTNVVCHIVQPRLYNHSVYEIKATELVAWGNRSLKHTAIEAYTGGGEFCTGEHCRFCKAKGVCRALANECSGINDKEVALLSPEEVADKLAVVPAVEAWCKALQEQALRTALSGVAIPRYKVVEGRSIRKYTDEKALLQALVDNGIDEKVVTRTSLVSLGELEKLLGKKSVADTYGQYIVKPQGKPTLVPEDDKREAIDATSDFANVNL